ncbi:hypothetical protein [Chryseobacterium sp.]|uniref:hypothetical protein n=1 Tax=Chryseobacterium sp. TaxID=1871047 RepID=UPI0011C8A17F|nr:hypothetical protein [Chryseobacterium sp.]TXF74921.1 hypothetical protein FUA25_11580 [Chryseobacterium sp.]
MENQQYRPEFRNDYVSRVFRTREEADNAYADLHGRGYSKDDVNVMMSDSTRDRYFTNSDNDSDLGDKVAENAGTGSMIGGGIGAVVGAIAAIGSNVLLPGLGLIIAGPLAAGLAGAGAGAAAGGLVGALTGAGVPEDEAKRYESDIKDGGIYMGYKPRNEEDARATYDRWYNDDTATRL